MDYLLRDRRAGTEGGGHSRTTPLEALATCVIDVFRLTRIGPFGHTQRAWQHETEEGRTSIATQAGLSTAFDRFDQANGQPPGETRADWQLKIVEPAVLQVADLFASLDMVNEHAEAISRGLLASGLLPAQASDRMRRSRAALGAEIARQLAATTLHELRCPPGSPATSWLGPRSLYASWLAGRRLGDHSQAVQYPVRGKGWNHQIRSTKLPIKLPLHAHDVDVELHQRHWTENRLKMTGTLIWHPIGNRIDLLLLQSSAFHHPGETAIAAFAAHLQSTGAAATAGPILLVDKIAKCGDLDREEVAQGVVEMVQELLRVHESRPKLAVVAWNTLPAPWIYPPQRDELLAEDWRALASTFEKTIVATRRLSEELRQADNGALVSNMLMWERNG